jgi:FkbM family methyltransferase
MAEVSEPTEDYVVVHSNHLIKIDALDSLGLRANSGIYESEETNLCKQLIHKGDRVLDVGANIGYYTLLFGDLVSPDGFVSAIEPDSENFELLVNNVKIPLALGLTEVHNLALGNKEHAAPLFRAIENTGMHRMYSSVCCGDGFTEVQVIRGDSLELAPLDFLKIDIEGYEPFALQGLIQTIKQSPQLKILCEFSPLSILEAKYSPVAFLNEMQDLGFKLVAHVQQQGWQQINYEDITQSLHRIPSLAIDEFEKKLKFSDGNRVIAEECVAFLTQHAYPRPILENLLFIASSAWQSVSSTLNIEVATVQCQ